MRSATEFAQYVTQTCSRHLLHIQRSVENGQATAEMDDTKLEISQQLQFCFLLGKLCFSEFTTNWTEPTQGINENAFPVGALECLEIAIKIVACVANQQQLVGFMKTITPDNDDPAPVDDKQTIHSCLDTFQVFERFLLLTVQVSSASACGTRFQNSNRKRSHDKHCFMFVQQGYGCHV